MNRLWWRLIRFWWQRRTRGWDDSETWNLDVTVAEFVLPRLRRFKEVAITLPLEMSEAEWAEELDCMIAAFEFVASDSNFTFTPWDESVQRGLELFGKRFIHLWW